MVEIKDIYQWIARRLNEEVLVKRPKKLTPLQEIEFNEKYGKSNQEIIDKFQLETKNRSFVNETLLPSPAIVQSITTNKMTAYASYNGYNRKGYGSSGGSTYELLRVNYVIYFDKSLYEAVKLIDNGDWVEIGGNITNFNSFMCQAIHDRGDWGKLVTSDVETTIPNKTEIGNNPWYSYVMNIEINLTAIKKISKMAFMDPFAISRIGAVKPSHSDGCFIATAAFGNQDISEVIVLRELRDKVLVNYLVGRIFIASYALLSPPIASIIRQSYLLRKLTRAFLRSIVLPFVGRIN